MKTQILRNEDESVATTVTPPFIYIKKLARLLQLIRDKKTSIGDKRVMECQHVI